MSDPVDYEKISSLIRGQLPAWLQEDHENFIAFLEAYYEFLEEFPGPTNIIHNHRRFVDIDETLDQFIYHFKNKLLPNIPESVLADPRKLAKNIKQFYKARGTEKSYEFLFRILYDKDIEFYYPKDDILIYDDGKWIEDHILFVVKCIDSSNPFLFEQLVITGKETGATALVDVVMSVQEGNYEIYKLYLNQYEGEFNIGEQVTATTEDGISVCAKVSGFVDSIDVVNHGLGYNVGDLVPINDGTGAGINALGRVKKTFNPGNITKINILEGGSGYRVGDPIIFDESYTSGFGAEAVVSQVSIDEVIPVDITIIGQVQNVVLDTIDHIVIKDYVEWINIERGGVVAIDLIDGGQNYDILPLATVGQQQPSYGIPAGQGAVLECENTNAGAIKEIEVIIPGVGYVPHPFWPKADLTQSGNGLATANVNIKGGPWKSGGYYKNDDGHYDSTKYIEDGEYYQLYSYVIKVDKSINEYRDIVKELVHPAGMKMFGQIDIITHIKTSDMEVGVELPNDYLEMIVALDPIVKVPFNIAENDNDPRVKIDIDIIAHTAFPIFIFHYEEEFIYPYKDMQLKDHPGFTDDRGTYSRSSVINIIS